MDKVYKENRGSEWHKWDLHVHTPASGLNNQFGGETDEVWDKYVTTLFNTAIANDVAVIGVTDYFLIDGFKKLKEDFLGNNDKLLNLFGSQDIVDKVKRIRLLPNIEFRLNTIIDNSRVNYHVILSDELSIEDIEDDFLGKLTLSIDQRTFGNQYKESLSKHGLEKLGERLKKQGCDFQGSNYRVGCQVAVISADEIQAVLSSNSKFHDKYIIVIPVDEDLHKLNWNSQALLVKKNYYQHANAYFTSSQGTHDFALGLKSESPEDFLNSFDTFKPCYIGSDCHSLKDIQEKLGQWDTKRKDQARITWIKADTTFNGLRQTLFEPDSRVKIQPSRPEPKADMHVIQSAYFIDASGDFNPNRKILFNENLNTIIGGKSSGKSLLLYSMAKAINREQVEDYYKALHLEGYNFINDFVLEWKDGKKDSFNSKEPSHKITYIPQLYINYLAERNNSRNLDEFILELLQQDEEFKIKYEQFNSEVEQIDKVIQDDLYKMFTCLEDWRKTRDDFNTTGLPDSIAKSIESLKKQIKDITEKSTLSEDEKKQHAIILKELEDITKQIDNNKRNAEFANRLEKLLKERIEGLVGYEAGVETHYPGDIDNLFAYYVIGVSQDLELLVSEIRDELTEKLRYYIQSIHDINLDKKLNDSLALQKKQNELLMPINKKIEGQKDIEKLQHSLSGLNARLAKSNDLVKRRKIIKQQFEDLKKKISKALEDRIKKYEDWVGRINTKYSRIDDDITLTATFGVNKEKYPLYDMVNKQRTTNTSFNNIFPPEKNSVSYKNVPPIIQNIKTLKDSVLTFKDNSIWYLNKDVDFHKLCEAVVENDFTIHYDVKYKNDNLQKMSPGKKGTVLLILYLQISTADYPILIDQPEDNLDNRTIYKQLCSMIKRKKSERQIIIVTHNANLVVGTDSENVIVANQEGQSGTGAKQKFKFEYVNGSIENSFTNPEEDDELLCQGIREHICDILEGGQEAFENREKKYGFRG